MKDPVVIINGNEVRCSDLIEDVEAARRKGLLGKFAFTTETVEALLQKFVINKQQIKPFNYSMERLRIAAAYWLEASDHEKTVDDGIILAKFSQYILEHHMDDINFVTGSDFEDMRRSINNGLTAIVNDIAALEAELSEIGELPNRKTRITELKQQLEDCIQSLEKYKIY